MVRSKEMPSRWRVGSRRVKLFSLEVEVLWAFFFFQIKTKNYTVQAKESLVENKEEKINELTLFS